MTFLDRYSEQAYAVLRIVAGLLFFAHGLQKFFDFPTAFPMPLSPMLTVAGRSEEHTSELQSLMRISYAVFCLKKKTTLQPATRSRDEQKTKEQHSEHQKSQENKHVIPSVTKNNNNYHQRTE